MFRTDTQIAMNVDAYVNATTSYRKSEGERQRDREKEQKGKICMIKMRMKKLLRETD